MASVCPDGFIRITDRLSRFSKIGGEMVPHVKVEEEAERITGGTACVVSLPDDRKGERLVVFYEETEVSAAELWKGLRESGLPGLWVPSRDCMVGISGIPRTGTGKADLARMREMAKDRARGS